MIYLLGEKQKQRINTKALKGIKRKTPTRCNKADCIMKGTLLPLTQSNTALRVILFPCPIINSNGELEMAKGAATNNSLLHYGIVLPKSLISNLTTSLKTQSGYCPVVMNTSKVTNNPKNQATPSTAKTTSNQNSIQNQGTASGSQTNTNNNAQKTRDNRNFKHSIEIDLKKFFNNKHLPQNSITNVLPNLICSVEPGTYVIDCGEEIDPSATLDQVFLNDLVKSAPNNKKEIAAKVKTLQDLIKYALSFNTTKQYINYYKGKDAKDYCGEGSWTDNRGPVKRYTPQEIQNMKDHNLLSKNYQESFFARGSHALNECLTANLEDGWLTVLLIA